MGTRGESRTVKLKVFKGDEYEIIHCRTKAKKMKTIIQTLINKGKINEDTTTKIEYLAS